MVSTSLTPSLPLGQGPAVKFKESETKAAAEVSPELSTQVCSEQGRVFRESQEHAGALAKENLRAKGWLGAKSLLVTEVHRRQRELLPSPT